MKRGSVLTKYFSIRCHFDPSHPCSSLEAGLHYIPACHSCLLHNYSSTIRAVTDDIIKAMRTCRESLQLSNLTDSSPSIHDSVYNVYRFSNDD